MNQTKRRLLLKLGFNDYNDYLNSEHWRRLKRSRLGRRSKCQCCWRAKATTIHHVSYRRLGQERRSDTMNLCIPCHNAIHTELDQRYFGRSPEYKAMRTGVAVRVIRRRM